MARTEGLLPRSGMVFGAAGSAGWRFHGPGRRALLWRSRWAVLTSLVMVGIFFAALGSSAACDLAAPPNVTASEDQPGQVTITWNAVPGATHYTVKRYWSQYGGAADGSGWPVNSPATSYVDLSPQCNGMWYSVQACSIACCSPESRRDRGQPGQTSRPGKPVVSASDCADVDGIEVCWTAVPGAVSYEIRRASAKLLLPLAPIREAQPPCDLDATAVPGVSYWYQVRAVSACSGNGDWSDADEGRRAFAAPVQVTATRCLGDRVELSWACVSGASGYEVLRDGVVVASPGGCLYVDRSVEAFREYEYRVRVDDTCARRSDPVMGTAGGVPGVPTNVRPGSGDYCLAWDEVAGADTYEVVRELGGQRSSVDASQTETCGLSEGDYRVRAGNACGWSAWSSTAVPVGRRQICDPFYDFESGVESWTLTGMWRVTGPTSHSPTHSLWFGNPNTGTYSLYPVLAQQMGRPTPVTGSTPRKIGGANGLAVSPPISIQGGESLTLRFAYLREVERTETGSFDRTLVEVRFDGAPWETVWMKDSTYPCTPFDPTPSGWLHAEISLEVPAGATTLRVRFSFDTVDSVYNDFRGWFIDDVCLARSQVAVGLASEPQWDETTRPVAVCRPNPVEDVHTATFSVQGVGAEALRLEVYDLAGQLVYSAEADEPELLWHTDSADGEYLANGVYLYRLWALVDGVWAACLETGKVVILR